DAADYPRRVGASVVTVAQVLFGNHANQGSEGLVASTMGRNEIGGGLRVDGGGRRRDVSLRPWA
ncbi:MAG: hypothetical protein M0T79_01230, partial [Actinomycetota bacterium]|nr:hypothetical protein [Actinomycetota bacterium]